MRSSSAYNMGDNEHCGLFHTRVSPRGGGGGGVGGGGEGGRARIIMASSWLSNTPFKVEEFSSLLSVIKCSRHHELHGFCIHLKLNHQLRHATIQLDCNEH